MMKPLRLTERAPLPFYKLPFIYPAAGMTVATRRVIVEVGPGRGDFLFHLAATNAEAYVVGIEVKRKRIDKLIQRVETRGFTNIVLIQADARQAIGDFFSPGQVTALHINFPDPWPKRAHAKHRLINAPFIAACVDILAPGGALFLTTDVEEYARSAAHVIAAAPALLSCYPEVVATICPDAFPTYFSQKWEREGRTIWYQKYHLT